MKTILSSAIGTCLLFYGAGVIAGDSKCTDINTGKEYTSTTSYFACNYPNGNCTWWAAHMRPDLAAAGITGDAGAWYVNAQNLNFYVGATPRVGAVAVFSNPSHVAYVEKRHDDGSFDVSEMDYYHSKGFTQGVNYATYHPNSDGTYHRNSGSQKWTLLGFIYGKKPSSVGGNSLCSRFNARFSICWTRGETDVSCAGGRDWTLYDNDAVSVIRVPTNEYCPDGSGDIGGGSGSMPISSGTNSGSLPDLIPNNSDIVNASKQKVTTLHIGEAAFCKMQAKNVGKKDAGAFESRCLISDGDKIDNNPRDEGKEDTKGLKKGDTKTEYEDFVAPKYPGKYNAVWCVDSAKQVTELNEGGNCHEEDKFTVWSRPNVSARSLALQGNPASLTPGQVFVADVTLVNAGENTGKTMLIGWYLDDILIATDRVLREHFEAGASKVETLEMGVAPMVAGMHELKVCGNFDGRIENEQNPADDCITKMIEVKVPWDPNTPGAVLWQDDGITPFDQSCGVVPQEPDFTKLPAVQVGDIGAVTVGVNRQRIYIPAANAASVGSGFWNTPTIDLAKVVKWCWNSNQTNTGDWGTDTSRACGVPVRQSDGSYVVDILNTPRASKGTWSVRLVGHSGDFWTDVSKWTDEKLDTDGHLRYGGWDFNRMELSVNAEGYSVLTARFGTPGLPGFWLSPGAMLSGQAFWHVVGEPGGGIPGNILCDPVTGKLSARIVGATPGSAGRVVLGTTKPNEYAWQGTDWILPADILRGAGEDYLLPNGPVVKSLRLDATYDAGAKRLTLTVPNKQLMPQAFWNAEDISKLTNKAVFQVWVTSGQARFVPGRVVVSDTGVVTIVFEGIGRGEGGSTYLVKVDGSQAWQKVGAFGFGSGIVSDPSGWYRMP